MNPNTAPPARTCDGCKWWHRESPHKMSPDHWGECTCKKIYEGGGSRADDEFSYWYTEGGGFDSGPKFGCIHWEARDES